MNKVFVDIDLLKIILEGETRKLTGKTCKRFEISDNKEEIKKAVKELIYEHGRDLLDFFKNGTVLFSNKSEEK
jgi:hypothetical protein